MSRCQRSGIALTQYRVHPPMAEEILLGQMCRPDDALRAGLVDTLVEGDASAVVDAAVAEQLELAGRSADAYAATKARRTRSPHRTVRNGSAFVPRIAASPTSGAAVRPQTWTLLRLRRGAFCFAFGVVHLCLTSAKCIFFAFAGAASERAALSPSAALAPSLPSRRAHVGGDPRDRVPSRVGQGP